MRKWSLIAVCALAFVSLSADAEAQFVWSPLDGRLLVNLTAAGQAGSQDVNRSSGFTLYEEPATVDVAQKIESGFVLEFGVGYRVREDYGVGLSYSSLESREDGVVSGALPHPLFFDRPRSFTQTAVGLEHKERAVHVSALWFVPFIERVDFTLSAGPSFFTVSQQFPDAANGVAFTEIPPGFDAVNVDVVPVVTREESAVGFHLGAEATYSFTPTIGAGVMLRFTRGSVDFDVPGGEATSVDAGGFQFGAGLRLRF